MELCQVTDDFVCVTMQRRWGLTAKRTGKEWHSGCMVCGGRDRMITFSNGGFFCRKCNAKGFLDDDKKNFKPDPILMQKWRDEIQSEKDAQAAKDSEWCKGFKAGYLQGWHDGMNAANRIWWNEQGISNHLVDKYNLGFLPAKRIQTEHGEIEIPAYTIPVVDLLTGDPLNIQYRLVDAPEGVAKYRQEFGISAREFYAETCTGELEPDAAIVLEGAKKAIVTYDHLDGAIQVVGLPGCSPSDAIVERLKHYSRIWIALDPGAERAAQRLKEKLPQARVMNLPGKPDDLMIAGMSKNCFKEYMRQSR